MQVVEKIILYNLEKVDFLDDVVNEVMVEIVCFVRERVFFRYIFFRIGEQLL